MNITSDLSKKLILASAALVVLVALGAWFVVVDKTTTPKETPASQVNSETRNSDPSFTEVKSQLISGFPQFPVYPGAQLEYSAKREKTSTPEGDFRAKWEIKDREAVDKVLQWYLTELPKYGWVITEPSSDREAMGEQGAQIAKNGLTATINVEAKEGKTEILVLIPGNQ